MATSYWADREGDVRVTEGRPSTAPDARHKRNLFVAPASSHVGLISFLGIGSKSVQIFMSSKTEISLSSLIHFGFARNTLLGTFSVSLFRQLRAVLKALLYISFNFYSHFSLLLFPTRGFCYISVNHCSFYVSGKFLIKTLHLWC